MLTKTECSSSGLIRALHPGGDATNPRCHGKKCVPVYFIVGSHSPSARVPASQRGPSQIVWYPACSQLTPFVTLAYVGSASHFALHSSSGDVVGAVHSPSSGAMPPGSWTRTLVRYPVGMCTVSQFHVDTSTASPVLIRSFIPGVL